ncbi:MAG: biopolymer transporter ExbD [Planctomycetota bacterium]|nr:biopolymer transporter ExbD [Planctomycetota bacterium]
MSKIREIQEEEIRMEMTPMIDVTFLLLVFFMCTIKFKSLEGKLAAYLPDGEGVDTTPAEPINKLEVKVELVQAGQRVLASDPAQAWSPGDGEFALVGHEVRYHLGRQTFAADAAGRAALVERLDTLHRTDPERPVVIRPGKVLHADVVLVLDACLEAGIEAISFSGSR